MEKAELHGVPQVQTGCQQVVRPRAGGWTWGQGGEGLARNEREAMGQRVGLGRGNLGSSVQGVE